MTSMKPILEKVKADSRYQRNIEYGEPRPGHPEGRVKFHIADLESNLEHLREKGISDEDYWKLKFLIHVHDIFKAEAEPNVPLLHPRNHASLARKFAAEFTADADLLNMIQFHDQNYALWEDLLRDGSYDANKLQSMLDIIQDLDLFLTFIIIDGCTKGKDYSKLTWFINEVKTYKATRIDTTWVLDQ